MSSTEPNIEALARDAALAAAIRAIVEHLDETGLLDRSHFVERFDKHLARVAETMPPAAQAAMNEIAALVRSPRAKIAL